MKLPKVIGLAGKAGAGKSTVAKYLNFKHGYVVTHVKDPMVAMVAALLKHMVPGMSDEEIDRRLDGDLKEAPIPGWPELSGRKLLQATGKDFRDAVWPNSDFFNELWWRTHSHNERFLNESVRYAADSRFIRDRGGLVIQVNGGPGISDNDGSHGKHVSENPNFTVDYTIENDSTIEALYDHVNEILENYAALKKSTEF